MQAWDVVVVGNDVAALRAAIAASDAGASVTVLCSRAPSSKSHSECGIAASLGESSHSAHAEETILVGDGLCDSEVVHSVATSAPHHLAELERWGVVLRRDGNGLPHLGQLPGQSTPRTANTGDSTARELLQILEEQCIKRRIPRRGDVEVFDLVMTENGIRGLIAMDIQTGSIFGIQSKAVILAGSGFESAWNGDGVGMGVAASLALRSDLPLANLEFTAMHPLTVADTDLHLPLDLLGAGAVVIGQDGSEMTSDDGSDALARAIVDAGGASLDMTGIPRSAKSWYAGTFDMLSSRCGIDASTENIPLMPAVVFTIGGIPVDASGNVVNNDWDSPVDGLFATGDAACSGMHGASASSGNRMLDAIAGGALTGKTAANHAKSTNFSGSSAISTALSEAHHMHDEILSKAGNGGTSVGALMGALTQTMQTHVGINRDAAGLSSAADSIRELRALEFGIQDSSTMMNTEYIAMRQTQGLLAIAEAVVASADARKESRGSHLRTDHPDANKKLTHYTLVDGDGTVSRLPCRN